MWRLVLVRRRLRRLAAPGAGAHGQGVLVEVFRRVCGGEAEVEAQGAPTPIITRGPGGGVRVETRLAAGEPAP
jgi:hypothetical protein